MAEGNDEMTFLYGEVRMLDLIAEEFKRELDLIKAHFGNASILKEKVGDEMQTTIKMSRSVKNPRGECFIPKKNQ